MTTFDERVLQLVFNVLRHVARTSFVFKYFEKIILGLLKKAVAEYLDSYQFAYTKGRNVEDVVLLLFDNKASHLEKEKRYERVLFIDFSSAFNTMQPPLMVKKLCDMNVHYNIISWILELLTSRRQFVKLNNSTSEIIVTKAV